VKIEAAEGEAAAVVNELPFAGDASGAIDSN
jgi:hypothetical protein